MIRSLVLASLLSTGCTVGVFVTDVKATPKGIEVTKCTLTQYGAASFSLEKCAAQPLEPPR